MPPQDSFASRLRAMRSARDLDKTSLADRIRVKVRTLSNWESGETEPTASNIAALCDALRVSSDYLLCRTDNEDGLRPGMVILNLDALRAAEVEGDNEAILGHTIPVRARLVSADQMREISAGIGKRGKR